MNAPLRNPERDLNDAAAGALREQAVENITERIKSGKSRVGIFELLESELNGERSQIMLEEITILLLNESGERDDLAEKTVAGMIERWISVHGDVVEDEAATIEATEEP